MNRILVVDDQGNILQMLKRRLNKIGGYQVLTSQSKEEAIAVLSSSPVDLVLLDYMMPDMNGYDFFLSFRDTYEVPVIMMTAHSSMNLVIEFMRNGGTDFVEKPLDIDLLHLRISRAINTHRAMQVEKAARKKAEDDLKTANIALKGKTEKLQKKNEELDGFTAMVSHDLRAPVRTISSFVALLKQRLNLESLDKETQELFDYVEEGAKKINNMISELLDFARMEVVSIKVDFFDTQEIVLRIVDELTRSNPLLSTYYDVGVLPKVKGDPVLIEQVFYNLIQNAVKYSSMQERPVVEIKAEKEGDEIIFSIKDNGVGFNMAYTVRLFNMFVRLHNATKDFEGSGVGLATVRRIIERHEGRVWAEGKEGQGATFFFSLPG